MVPITGPVSTQTQNGLLPGASFYEERTRYGQKPPYDLALPYRVYRRDHSAVDVSGSHPWIDSHQGFLAYGSQGNERTWAYTYTAAVPTDLMTQVLAKARSKALAKIGDTAGWGENLAEYRQAASMMSYRLWTIARSLAMLRSGNLKQALRMLNLSPDSAALKGLPSMKLTPRNVARHYAAIWMELHFGWEPLLGDIFDTITILSETLPEGGSVSEGSFLHTSRDYYAAGNDYTGLPSFSGKHDVKAWARVSFRWEVVNPNLYLARRLGIVNPVSLAWNLAPMSWFVDWIVDISGYLNQWSDLFGIRLSEPCYSRGYRDVCASEVLCIYANSVWYNYKSTTQAMFHERQLGFSEAQLRINNPFYHISVARGLTAISYLIQKGIGKGSI